MATADVEKVAPEKAPAKILTEKQARALTEKIRNTAGQLPDLMLQAYEQEAWTSLGYETWTTYVEGEFGMSYSNSWRIVRQGRVQRQLTEVAGSPVVVSAQEAQQISESDGIVSGEILERVKAGKDDVRTIVRSTVAERTSRGREVMAPVESTDGAVRISIPQWLKDNDLWKLVTRAAKHVGEDDPTVWVVKTLTSTIAAMDLPAEEPRRARQRAPRGDAADTEGQSSEQPPEVQSEPVDVEPAEPVSNQSDHNPLG